MAGILDSKSRIMDTLLTTTGRDQAARGELDVKFASITDRQIFYSTGSDVPHEMISSSYVTDVTYNILKSSPDGITEP